MEEACKAKGKQQALLASVRSSGACSCRRESRLVWDCGSSPVRLGIASPNGSARPLRAGFTQPIANWEGGKRDVISAVFYICVTLVPAPDLCVSAL